MLDKSVPYVDVLMRRPKGAALPEAALPAGYRFAFFRAGDEADWARIETSVGEFDSEADALRHFQRVFLPLLPELERRCLFVEAADGEKVATCTAWWEDTGARRDPLLHWLAVKPGHQGKRLGKALAAKIVRLMADIEGDGDIFLHTQTWSHKAIKIYESLGFEITEVPGSAKYSSENVQKAIGILRGIYRDA